MATLSSGKIAEVIFEEYMLTTEKQQMLLPLVERFEPEAATMQNSNNFVWRTVEQQRPILTGWDLTGQEQGIIEETYPAVLGLPKNDLIEQRADDVRDMTFWRRAGKRSAERQASEMNKTIAQRIALQGSLFYRYDATTSPSGFDFVAEAQALMNERQGYISQRHFVLNDRDNKTFAQDLAGRQTLQGRPESEAWMKGQIGANVAQFDLHVGSFLPNLVGGVSPDTTVTGDQSFAPEAGSVDSASGIVTNVDYRSATIPVAASASYNVGDKVTFENGGTPVYAVGLDDKTVTTTPMTFTIVAKPDATSITVYPKPIALDDPGLTVLEAAYANVNTQILNAAVVVRQNTDASARTNIFWDEESVEVFSGSIPAQYFNQFGGKKVIEDTMANGQKVYMLYDADIKTMNFDYRIFTWWDVTIKDPSRCGCAVTFTT